MIDGSMALYDALCILYRPHEHAQFTHRLGFSCQTATPNTDDRPITLAI